MRSADLLARIIKPWAELSEADRIARVCLRVERHIHDCMAQRVPCGSVKLGGESYTVHEGVVAALRAHNYLVDILEQRDGMITLHIVWNKAEHAGVEDHEVFGKPIGNA